jgi:hypothetical protein
VLVLSARDQVLKVSYKCLRNLNRPKSNQTHKEIEEDDDDDIY